MSRRSRQARKPRPPRAGGPTPLEPPVDGRLKPPTRNQLAALFALASRAGVRTPEPRTRGEASHRIHELRQALTQP